LLNLLLRIDQLLDDDAFDITSEVVSHLVAEVRALTRPSPSIEPLKWCSLTSKSRASCWRKPRNSIRYKPSDSYLIPFFVRRLFKSSVLFACGSSGFFHRVGPF
jgi:hypothetical protein